MRRERGATLTILALALSVLLVTLASAFMDAATLDLQLTGTQARKAQAFGLAEAGLARAIQALESGHEPPLSGSLSTGSYTIEIREVEPSVHDIHVTGQVPDLNEEARPRVQARVMVTGDPGSRKATLLSWRHANE